VSEYYLVYVIQKGQPQISIAGGRIECGSVSEYYLVCVIQKGQPKISMAKDQVASRDGRSGGKKTKKNGVR